MYQYSKKAGDLLTFGERLKQERKAHNLSQDVISGLCGLSRETWSKYETDQRLPTFTNLLQIADTLNVSTDYLFGRTAERKNLGL